MRIRFVAQEAAQAALEILEQNGFAAKRSGTVVRARCPTLWAVPILTRAIGLEQIEWLDIASPRLQRDGRVLVAPEVPRGAQLGPVIRDTP